MDTWIKQKKNRPSSINFFNFAPFYKHISSSAYLTCLLHLKEVIEAESKILIGRGAGGGGERGDVSPRVQSFSYADE